MVVKEYVLPIHVTHDARKLALESLEHEAQLLSTLDHDNLVKMLGFFVEDHRAYLVLEHIAGTNLQDLVESRGPLPEEEVRRLARQMCDILDYLHSQSPPLIHRDFTPDNLMLSDTGHLKLVDFTLARESDNFTAAIIAGKRSYMPPEQVKGKPVPQSDIYAFGACLYFLLTGQEPEPLSVLHPRDANPLVSSEIDEIVAGCTQLSIDDRYGSIQQVLSIQQSVRSLTETTSSG